MKTFGIVLFYAFLVLSVTVIIVTVIKTKRFFSATLLSVLQGVGSLFAVNFIGSFIGVHINVNALSLAVSSLFGTSGVIALLFTQLLFR
ncbi:MAG: hypothetical protein E7515_08575 [Ruminococcaceae bacterium]|jgi:hypothetical protein|nr:hypothetical protein [Oscillospiraceae bacterium]